MDVWVMGERLAPGMQHGNDAKLGAEVPGISGNDPQRLGRRPEQDGVDHRLVLEGDLGDRGRQGEGDVEVGHRQQLSLSRREPVGTGLPLALRAVPVAAGVVGVADEAAVRAALDMTAQRRRPAQLDGAHHPPLDPAQVAVMGLGVGVVVAAEDIRHL
jgi:hypothetical protein